MQHQDVSVHCGAAYPAVQAHDSSRNQEVIQYLPYLHRESKKQDTKLLAITSLTIIRFSKKIFTSRLGSKFATNSCLNIPSHFKDVATLRCEV